MRSLSGNGANIKIKQLKKKPFTLICEGRLYLRQRIEGYRTTKEWVVEFLRDNFFWAGEAITNLSKSTIYKDRFLIDSKSSKANNGDVLVKGSPRPALLSTSFKTSCRS